MKLTGWLLCGLGILAACGDDKPPAVIDAHPIHDAAADASAGACLASDQCSGTANPACCLVVSPGGAVEPAHCGSTSSATCGYVACRGAADPCMTTTGASGTCTLETVSSSAMPYWVCQ